VVDVVASVRVELPPEVTEVGLKEAVAPDGRPLAESATDCAEPPVRVVLTVEVPLWLGVTLTLAGLALMEKSFVVVEPHPGNVKDAMRVLQLNEPLLFRYSLVNQKVQSSTGSTVMAL
jgi:hypothetical protein